MKADTTKRTIRLPREDAEFAKAYAEAHGLTVTEVIDRYLHSLRLASASELSPEIDAISGLVPSNIDAEEEHLRAVR